MQVAAPLLASFIRAALLTLVFRNHEFALESEGVEGYTNTAIGLAANLPGAMAGTLYGSARR